MLGILVWWAVPVVAVAVATLGAAIGRRVRRGHDDMFTTQRYARALTSLARTQRPGTDGLPNRTATGTGDVRVFAGPETDEVPQA